MTHFYAQLRVPAQETRMKIAPARDGVRLEFGDRFLFLTESMALDVANAIADCLETSKGTPNV